MCLICPPMVHAYINTVMWVSHCPPLPPVHFPAHVSTFPSPTSSFAYIQDIIIDINFVSSILSGTCFTFPVVCEIPGVWVCCTEQIFPYWTSYSFRLHRSRHWSWQAFSCHLPAQLLPAQLLTTNSVPQRADFRCPQQCAATTWRFSCTTQRQ